MVRFLAGFCVLLTTACLWLGAQPGASRSSAGVSSSVPTGQRLTYGIEWRLIRAGLAVIESQPTRTELKLSSAGLVSKMYKVQDTYTVQYDEPYCATSSLMDAMEGKRHRETRIRFDRSQNHAFFTERDLVKDAIVRTADVAIPHCVHDVMGALATLRRVIIEPGTTIELPVSDGRKSAQVKIHAQEREPITTPAGTFQTIRFEAELLNGVVYARKGRVHIWMSDDPRHLPVQIRLRMNFPLGTVTLSLEKEESL